MKSSRSTVSSNQSENNTNSLQIRLQKVIADAGVTSRRKAEEMIVQGRVEVNGEIIDKLGTKVDPQKDVIYVDGNVVDSRQVHKIYMVMHKPRGVMTTVFDPEGRKTVIDYCKEVSERIYPVGRLDYLSEGLLLLTNDGEFANSVIHPSFGVEKVYEVKVFGIVNNVILRKLQKGVQLEDGFVRPLSIRILKHLNNKTWIEFRLAEGKNREVRRICEACGLTVDKLKRVAIGALSVDGIAPGNYRIFSKSQILKKLGISKSGKIDENQRYKSPKRSINMRRKKINVVNNADDEVFQMYRRERYFQTLKEIDAAKKAKEKEEAEARKNEFLKESERRASSKNNRA